MTSPALPSPAAAPAPRANRRHRRRRLLPWLGGALLLGAIVAGFRPQPAPVETARVTTGLLRATVNEEGRTRIRQRYVVSAPVAGYLRRIPFKAGAEVEAGRTVVAAVDPLAPALLDARTRSLAEARRDTAAANLAKAEEALRFATLELRRIEQLFKDGGVSRQDLEDSQWRETATRKEVAAATSALRQVEAELAESTALVDASASENPGPRTVEITSPASGRVLRVLEENARVVAAGTPLLEVGDPADLEAVVDVLSRDGAAIRPGAAVLLEQWGGGAPLAGKVRLVEPAAFTKVSALGVEEQRVNVIVDLLTPPEERRSLGDNFRVEARIVVWESDRTLQIPSGGLFRRGPQWAAFVVEAGRAVLRTVEAGRSNGRETQVLSGLAEGDEVILYPGDRVHEGQRVRPVVLTR